MHDKGNEENIFDRVDYQISTGDSIHLNLAYTRSWFQTPNSFDAENATPWYGVVVDNGGLGPNGDARRTDGPALEDRNLQHRALLDALHQLQCRIDTRRFRPPRRLQLLSQRKSLRGPRPAKPSAGNRLPESAPSPTRALRSSISYVQGINNIKAGVTYEQTFLNEDDHFGIVDPTLNAPCLTLGTAADPDVPVQGFHRSVPVRGGRILGKMSLP